MKRLPELDGIRGMAIVAVMIYHLEHLFVLGWVGTPGKILSRLLSPGWLGVDIFFVLSGFLITRVLVEERSKPSFWKNFYTKRFLRIQPAFLLVFAVVLICIPFPPIKIFLAYLFFLANWTVLWFAEVVPLGHIWSLAVEEQFYLLWPLLVRRLDVRKLFYVALVIAAASSMLRIVLVFAHVNSYVIYKITPTRLDGLAWGAAIALATYLPREQAFLMQYRRPLLILAGSVWLGGFAAGGLSYFAWNAKGTITAIPGVVIPTGLLILSCLDGTVLPWLRTLLLKHSLGWFGRRSYALYLIHESLHQTAQYFIRNHHFANMRILSAVGLIASLIVVALSVGLAELSWRLVEGPALRLASRITHRPEVLVTR